MQIVAGKVNEDIFRDGDEREIKAFRIDFASGHKILALSNRPSNLRGKQGRVIIDEAAFVEDLPELLKAALALLMWGGQVIIISTHDGAENPFNELIQDVRAGNLPYSLHRITLDDALSAGLYRRICRVTKQNWTPEAEEAWRADLIKTYGDGADEELFCIPRQSSGAYLTTGMIEACMEAVPVLTWTPPAGDFVDWPLPVAERYTKGWMRNSLNLFSPACRKTGRISAAWTLAAAATSPYSGPRRKKRICALCRPLCWSCATARTERNSRFFSPCWTPCRVFPAYRWTHGGTVRPLRKRPGSSTGLAGFGKS
ncbi:hypothetical protein DESPIG_01647 [Desulfovibrio piger ATCC 29098]|uniref:Uncharacterized protein n=1 Tax=Desulfovibrio piger ATCC 29098 TaxID=411464 RepID=B6WU89_9BACT|nr:hypothetical protein DESPIG_01647 [Desulfovibrio piger ATCC 29098]